MRVNSQASIQQARRALSGYGDWEKLREKAERREDGVLVVKVKAASNAEAANDPYGKKS